jgi:hypothetical protein
MEFRILRSFKTVHSITEFIGKPAAMIKEEVSKKLQFRSQSELDWIDVPVIDFDEDTGEYIAPKS